MANGKGEEAIKVTRLRKSPPTSTVPGDGKVKEDMMARRHERSAARYTDPAKAKMGG